MIVELCLFYEVSDNELAIAGFSILESKKKPIVVAISIEIIFNKQMVLSILTLLYIEISSTNIPRLKVRINNIPPIMRIAFLFMLEFLEEFPIVIDQRIDAFEFTDERFVIIAVGL